MTIMDDMTIFEKVTLLISGVGISGLGLGWGLKQSNSSARQKTDIENLKEDVDEIKEDVDSIRGEFHLTIREIRSDMRDDVGQIHKKLDDLTMGLANAGLIAATKKLSE